MPVVLPLSEFSARLSSRSGSLSELKLGSLELSLSDHLPIPEGALAGTPVATVAPPMFSFGGCLALPVLSDTVWTHDERKDVQEQQTVRAPGVLLRCASGAGGPSYSAGAASAPSLTMAQAAAVGPGTRELEPASSLSSLERPHLPNPELKLAHAQAR